MGHEHDLLFSHERGGTGAHGGGRDQRGRTLMLVRRRKRLVHIAMKVLLLGTTGTESSFQTWQLSLNQVGVPVDAIALRGRGHVADPLGGRWAAALPGRDSVHRRAFRRGAEPGAPGGARGAGVSVWHPPADRARGTGVQTTACTQHAHGSAGSRQCRSDSERPDGLRGRLPIDPGSWGYLATPVSQEHFETLVAATDGSALVGIHRRRDGREEMVRRSTPTLTKRRLTCCAGASWSG